MHRLVRTAALATVLTVAGYLVACDSHDDPAIPGLADVVYGGETSDEALELMLDASPTVSATRGAQFDSPVEGAALPAAPTALTWHTLSVAQTEPANQAPRLAQTDWHRWLGVTEALAHGAPLLGKAYFLVVSSAKDAKLLRVFTTSATYTPSTVQWNKLKGVGQLTATVTTATFDANKLAQDGGPFAGTPVHFTVTP